MALRHCAAARVPAGMEEAGNNIPPHPNNVDQPDPSGHTESCPSERCTYDITLTSLEGHQVYLGNSHIDICTHHVPPPTFLRDP